jgi:tetratricopeptide (TPR) repeat protein
MANEPTHDNPENEEPQGDFAALLGHVKQNPVLYAASIVFLAACALVGVLYNLKTATDQQTIATVYARAIDIEDPAERAAALEEVASGGSTLAPNALYMRGEAALLANDFDLARQSFEQLQSGHPEFDQTPDAVEGLGFILEQQDDLKGALAKYEEVLAKWPNSFAGRRQQFSIGRCQEQLGQLEAAIQAYQEQLQLFPGSGVARRAQQSIDRLRGSNPELFPQIETIPLDDVTVEPAPTLSDDVPEITLPDQESANEEAETSPEE